MASVLMGNRSDGLSHDLVTMTFDFRGHGAARDAPLHAPTVYQVSSSYRPFRSADMTHFLSQY